MTLPARIDRRELRGKPKLRSPAHRDWVREHMCVVPGCANMPIEAMHVRTAANAGTGMKPSDAYTCSGCTEHHRECHRIGEKSFEAKYKINLMALAREFFERSPFRSRLDNPFND
jgi:hypothetical protein